MERRSAILDLGRSEARIPCINANHSTICKFAFEDESYREVIDEIETLVSWATSTTNISKSNFLRLVKGSPFPSMPESNSNPESNDSFKNGTIFEDDEVPITTTIALLRSPPQSIRKVRRGPFFLVPFPKNLGFTGRRQVLHRLKEFSTCPDALNNKAALCGLGGIGKSQVALEYAYWYQMNIPDHSVFWIEARNPDQLQDSLDLIAAHCRVSRPSDTRQDMLDQIRTWLSNPNNGSWLMIIDGVDDVLTVNSVPPSNNTKGTSVPIQALSAVRELGYYIPTPTHGRLLYTTNNRSTAEILASKGRIIEVKSLDHDDATFLLEKQLIERPAHWSDEKSAQQIWRDDELQELAKKLDYIPLALVQAASYLRETSLSIVDYLQLLNINELEMIKILEQNPKGDDAITDHISDAIMSTWTLTIEQMETQCEPAIEIFSLLVFFDSQHIPQDLLRNFQGFNGQMIARSLEVLTAYAFITVGAQANTFNVHHLVQLAMYKRLSFLKLERKWAIKALTLLSQEFPDGNYESWDMCQVLLPHATKVLRRGFYGPAEAGIVATLQAKMSWYYLTRGAFEKAEILNQCALVNMVLMPSMKPEKVLAVKSRRIIVLQKLGRFDEAENMAQEVWKAFGSLLGPKHEDTLQSLSLLSLVYHEQGKYAAGEKVIRKILKSIGRSIEADDIQMLEARLRLGNNLCSLGQYDEAEKYTDETVILYDKKLGHKHPGTLKAYYKLAQIYYCQGRYEQAEKLNFKTWTLQKEVIGVDHPDTLKSLYELANNLQAQHKFALAESHKRDTYQSAIRLVGRFHRYTLLAASGLASCLLEASLDNDWSSPKGLAEVEDLYQLSLSGLEKGLRINHPMAIAARTDYCIVRRLRSSAQLTELEAEEKDNLKKLKVILGKEHQVTIKSRESLSRILWAQQRGDTSKWKKALKHARKVLQVREKCLGWFREGTIVRQETLVAAELVLEMLPEGKERQKLVQKIAATRSVYSFQEIDDEYYDTQPSKEDGDV